MSTDVEVTVRGDAYAIIPGATYILECDRHISARELHELRDALKDKTGAKWVVLSKGLHVVPAQPAEDAS